MIVRGPDYEIRSGNSNNVYWEQAVYPEWAAISAFRGFPGQRRGAGVEPHYHDNDEIWLFLSGHGEVWLDGASFEITPHTVVYTPMGVVHRFQMFTDFDNVAMVTRLERQKRAAHILVEEAGPPVPTVPGFVVPGAENVGPFLDRGPRCPLSELRAITLAPGDEIDAARLQGLEYWLLLEGSLSLDLDGREVELSSGDLALLRPGLVRRLRAPDGARVARARE
jgi:mannose-6-phosphate isomerase-like protein (cupin superfamily)